jgi:glycosyltransferase involved in cell wall biosynthesis
MFVMPSRSEGLPRAMVEAMARGLPCIGSRVGGITELLPLEDTVPVGDPGALANAIQTVLRDPKRLERMSERNLATASEYRADVLRARRIAVYRYLRDRTAAWSEAAVASCHAEWRRPDVGV